MKMLVVLCLVAAAVAAPQSSAGYGHSEIIKYNYDNPGFGGYYYDVETSDGTKADQRGVVKNEGTKDEFLTVQGSYAYVGPDGVTYVVRYTADENGYHPEIEKGGKFVGTAVEKPRKSEKKGGIPPEVLAILG